jgi:hypothetical protein
MNAATWLGSWVALLVTALIIAVLVISRRLPVLALIVVLFAWASTQAQVMTSGPTVSAPGSPVMTGRPMAVSGLPGYASL